MPRSLAGVRIRERRRALGVKQADLARMMGISPSYLNLIESNKRGVSAQLVRAAAEALELPIDALDGAAERRLADTLGEVAADPDYRDLGIEPAQAAEMIGRSPGWARALARAWAASRERARQVDALSDRLTHDPFLSDAVHRMLTNIAAIRSTSEILESVDDIDPRQRRRFHEILLAESGRISEVAESLARFFDADKARVGGAAPGEEIEEAFLAAGNRFERLELAAQDLRGDPSGPGPDAEPEERDLRRMLARAGVAALDDDPERPGAQEARDLPGRRAVVLPPGAPPARRRLAAARALVRAAAGEALAAEIAERPNLAADAARRRFEAALADYAADAFLTPYDAFLEAGRALRWDVDALAARFGIGFDQAARRMTSLTRPEAHGPRAAYMQVNAAGFALSRRNLPDIALPRYGAACPLWAVYRALTRPDATVRQVAEFPTGERFVFVARATRTDAGAWGRDGQVRATLLALPGEAAGATIYAPALGEEPDPVGPNCRICARRACSHRAEDPVFG